MYKNNPIFYEKFPCIMGIINCNDNSFYKESRIQSKKKLYRRIEQMLCEGALIIDVGGQSTNPKSTVLNVCEELDNMVPYCSDLGKDFPGVIFSIDTFYARTARWAVEVGFRIVNDISGGNFDSDMLVTVADLHVPFIINHKTTLDENLDIVSAVDSFFHTRIVECTQLGITNLILDVGIGFGKTVLQNFTLLKNLSVFKKYGYPLLVGVSRKSLIYHTLGGTTDTALNGTTVLNTLSLLNGADIIRVHDVKEAREVITILKTYRRS